MGKSEKARVYTRLPMLRAERSLSRKELAEILSVHYQTIGYIERGEFVPSLEIALKAAEYFGLPVEAIFSLKPFEPLNAASLAGG
ncbi:MAG: helix-turn-helix transcriptional regulator [Xanthomonadales bacterium]|nr:helix-turn-helix transcriptional regulator [Xanthomonadales bacterium]